jgi:hypothetical protein
MDKELDNLAQRYALTRRITLGERLGFCVHGIVFAAEDDAKPSFLAVKFHREAVPFERECRAYRRLQEEHVARILGFNVPQLLRIDQEWHTIKMTIVPQPFLLDFADALLDQAPDFSDDVLRQWEKDKEEIFRRKMAGGYSSTRSPA